MKPLEPGCLAIVISDNENPENVGKEVIVQFNVRERGEIGILLNSGGRGVIASGVVLEPGWLVNGNVRTYVDLSGNRIEDRSSFAFKGLAESFLDQEGEKFNAFFEPHQLMRIDDFSDEDKQKDREQEIGRGLLTPVVWVGDRYSNVE